MHKPVLFVMGVTAPKVRAYLRRYFIIMVIMNFNDLEKIRPTHLLLSEDLAAPFLGYIVKNEIAISHVVLLTTEIRFHQSALFDRTVNVTRLHKAVDLLSCPLTLEMKEEANKVPKDVIAVLALDKFPYVEIDEMEEVTREKKTHIKSCEHCNRELQRQLQERIARKRQATRQKKVKHS